MERSLYIVPRWAGRPDTDFYSQVVLAPGARHFNNPREPAVMETLLAHFGSTPNAHE